MNPVLDEVKSVLLVIVPKFSENIGVPNIPCPQTFPHKKRRIGSKIIFAKWLTDNPRGEDKLFLIYVSLYFYSIP
ncbi:hypothetical protein D3C86_1368570 [compost metagenome]